MPLLVALLDILCGTASAPAALAPAQIWSPRSFLNISVGMAVPAVLCIDRAAHRQGACTQCAPAAQTFRANLIALHGVQKMGGLISHPYVAAS